MNDSTVLWDTLARQFENLANSSMPIPHVLAMWPESIDLPKNDFGQVIRPRSCMYPFESGYKEHQLVPDPRNGIIQFEWWPPNQGGPNSNEMLLLQLKGLTDHAASAISPSEAGAASTISNSRRRWITTLHLLLGRTCRHYRFQADGWPHLDFAIMGSLVTQFHAESNELNRGNLRTMHFLANYLDTQVTSGSPLFGMIGIVLPDDMIAELIAPEPAANHIVYSVLDNLAFTSALACRTFSKRNSCSDTRDETFPGPTSTTLFLTHIDASRTVVLNPLGEERCRYVPGETLAGARPVIPNALLNAAQIVAEEPLSDRSQNVLIAMLDLGAIDSDDRSTTAEIMEKAHGKAADFNSIKPVMAELNGHELIKSKTGRGGGCWLTDKGRIRAEKLRTARSRNSARP